MNPGCRIGLVMLMGTALGALGSEALHSEAVPPAYLIGQIDVSDPSRHMEGSWWRLRARPRPVHRSLPSMAIHPNASLSMSIRAWRRFGPGEAIQPTCKFEPLARSTRRTTHLLLRAPPPISPDRPWRRKRQSRIV
jgi:hypothetical protein